MQFWSGIVGLGIRPIVKFRDGTGRALIYVRGGGNVFWKWIGEESILTV